MCFFLEAPPGFGPGVEVLQTFALPLGHGAILIWDSSTMRMRIVEFAPAISGADYGARTRHLRLGKATLYQMS